MPTIAKNLEQTSINTIRTLAMDAVEAANSGHPGTPMALAPVAYQLWTQHLQYDPAAPLWMNRDRYVLSCGHASMLLYALIHLAGIVEAGDSPAQQGAGEPPAPRKLAHCAGKPPAPRKPALPLEDLRNFRQWGSRTPGHPEVGHTTGVETTTGPLGQGCGNSVGMAIAGRWLAARYNAPGFTLFNYRVWVQCSDGDLMEGVACEAASLAGHLKLDNLCWIYDDNGITIEGHTELAFSEDVATRFRGLGWNVLTVGDANDLAALDVAYQKARKHQGSPTLIVVKSVIACGSPNKAGTADAHGAALGAKEVAATKAAYGWPADAQFLVPHEVPAHFQATLGERGRAAREAWDKLFARYEKEHAELAAELKLIRSGRLPEGWRDAQPRFEADAKGMATRVSGGKVLNAFAIRIPWLLGGSADLAPSTKTLLTFDEAIGSFSERNPFGRNLHFGIREHAMAAAVNGMTLCGLRAYGATFFVFSDYCRPSLRLAALMGVPSITVFTHDSIGVGEDGPTHQPVEQLAACRAIPRLLVLRPADANEAAVAWRVALEQTDHPSVLVLTRQDLPTLDRTKYGSAEGAARGGYVLVDDVDVRGRETDAQRGAGLPDVILMATGSEVPLALAAHEQLVAAGVRSRVVSLPSFELFDEQPATYRDQVLPPQVTARVAIEAGIRQGWDRYLGASGVFIGLDGFGASAPYQEVYKHRGLTAEAVVAAARKQI